MTGVWFWAFECPKGLWFGFDERDCYYLVRSSCQPTMPPKRPGTDQGAV
jgi:hypothetical protein